MSLVRAFLLALWVIAALPAQVEPLPRLNFPTQVEPLPLVDPAEDAAPPAIRSARDQVFRGTAVLFDEHPKPLPPGAPGPPPAPVSIVHMKALPELPLDESDDVAVGRVIAVQPFVTLNRRCLYQEFQVRISETVKDTMKPDQAITLLRQGGQARLPDGRTVGWSVGGLGEPPETGNQYLFFLTRREGADAYVAVKAWEIRSEEIFAVTPDDEARAALGRSDYHGRLLLTALADMRTRMAREAP